MLLNNVIIIPLLLSILLNAFAHMRHFYLRLRWNKVVVVVVFSRQNKKIIALVDTELVAISIGGTIPLNVRQSALPCMASGALIQVCHNFFYTAFSTIYHDCPPAADDSVGSAK